MNRKEIASVIHDVGLQFGKFKLASGEHSHFKVEMEDVFAHPEYKAAIARAMIGILPDNTDNIGGIETGGAQLAITMAEIAGLNLIIVKKPQHTTRIEGNITTGNTVHIVDDVATKGGTILYAAEAIENSFQIKPSSASVVVQREPDTTQHLKHQGITLNTLYSLEEILQAGEMELPTP